MKCPVCGKGQLKRETRSMPFSYRGVTLHVDQPGDWCEACGEGVAAIYAECRKRNKNVFI